MLVLERDSLAKKRQHKKLYPDDVGMHRLGPFREMCRAILLDYS